MNLTLHQFLKEFRYVRWRWFAFLALLAFDLVVNLEWLLPMRAGVTTPVWLGFVPVFVLLSGLSLLLSCPEDRPGSDRSFIGTRPLPWLSYWVARAMIWLLLVVLPVVLQNGLYLLLSDRPMADVLRGAWERLCFAVGFSAWLLPSLALWRRNETWRALIVVVLVLFVASKALDITAATGWKFYPSYAQKWSGLAAGWAVFGVLTAGLAWGHLRRGWRFRLRLWMSIVACLAGLLVARFWVLTSPEVRAQDSDLVRELAPNLNVNIDLATAEYNGFEREPAWGFVAAPKTTTGAKGVHVSMRLAESQIEQEGLETSTCPSSVFDIQAGAFEPPQAEVYRGDTNLRDFFPPGTLFFSSLPYPRWSFEGRTSSLAAFTPPYPVADQPLRITSRFDMDWYQRDLAIEIPVEVGSKGECDEVRWEILGVTAADGPQPGALTIYLRTETRSHWDAENGSTILLHSPRRQLVWLDTGNLAVLGTRSTDTGLVRRQIELTWDHVTHHADGEVAEDDVSKLHLIFLRSRYLGRSPYLWKSPEIRLAEFPPSMGYDQLNWSDSADSGALYRGRELISYEERMATIPPPMAESTEQEARRYVYDFFSIAAATRAVYTYQAHPLIAQAFEPLGRDHLPLMLDLRSEGWPGWSNRPPNNQLVRYVTERQREALIDRATQSVGLAQLVITKGWAEAAKRLKSQVMRMRSLSPAAIDLLMAWGDEESNERLLREMPYDMNDEIAEHLDKTPEFRSQLETILQREFDAVLPLAGANGNLAIRKIAVAAEFGSPEAFELCLRWLGASSDFTPQTYGSPHPRFLEADGSPFWKRRMPEYEIGPFFRKLTVSDFEYVPEQRAWRFLKP